MSSNNDRKNPKVGSPVVITNAQDSLSSEQRGRQRRYFITMMVRTACFIATIFLPSPYRWFAMGSALVLPYIAVVIANAGRETINGKSAILKDKKREITGA